jgi:ketosteroid isomerase-like protein
MKPSRQALTDVAGGMLLAFTLMSTAATTPTGNTLSDSDQLIANENAWAKASLDGNADRMASYMAEEYVELTWETATESAPAHWSSTGKKQWVEAVRRRTEVYTSVKVRNLSVHVQGTVAVVTGEYSQTGTHNGKDISGTGIYANTWLKRDGRWVVVHSVFP